MKFLFKILKWTFISIGGLIGIFIIAFLVYNKLFYEREMIQIKNKLNELENVKVVDIWGHEDMTLKEISARLQIKEKGEIVLYGLSADAFNYPKRVPMTEIDGYSFTWFSCNGGIGPSVYIGTQGQLGQLIDKEFKTVKDVVNNYALILETIKSLKMSPEINHFETDKSESYLLVENEKSSDQDPIFNLVGIENKFEFAETLKWNKSDCYYNKKNEKTVAIKGRLISG